MVVLSKPAISITRPATKPTTTTTATATLLPFIIPTIDLSRPDPKAVIKACEEFGFFKVINHGIPTETITNLESKAMNFFTLPSTEKERAASPSNPFGYGNKKIGPNGDVGWLEYLLMTADHPELLDVGGDDPEQFRSAVNDYVSEVRRMACGIVELVADGLRIQPLDVFSRLLKDEQSDSLFRINYYPPPPPTTMNSHSHNSNNRSLVGFGEHTDPQIISVLRSNNTSGLEISLGDGSWVSVPPDQSSFFINVGDSLEVMTNGRFKSVRHRVMLLPNSNSHSNSNSSSNSSSSNFQKSRISMVYFGGPPMGEKIAPLPCLMGVDQTSLYKEFTWFEYKKSAYKSRLADNRLQLFQKQIAAS